MTVLSGTEKVSKYPHTVKSDVLVSVCIQTYNHEKYLERCLDGILNQETNFNFEILLGEDNSKDRTRAICMEYADKYPDKIRLFLHSRDNVIYIGGNPTGRYNLLHNLLNANGEFIAFCEGDDYWIDPKKLQKQVDFLQANRDYSFTFHRIYSIKETTQKITKSFRGETGGKTYYTKDFIVDFPASFLSLVFRNNLIEIPDWFKTVYGGDIFLMMLLSTKGNAYCHQEYMGVYNVHGGGLTGQWAKNNLFKETKEVIAGLNFFNDHTAGRYEKAVIKRKKKLILKYQLLTTDKTLHRLKLDFIITFLYSQITYLAVRTFVARNIRYFFNLK